MVLTYKVVKHNLTVNQILKNDLEFSSRLLQKIIKNNLLTVNEKKYDTRNTVNIGDIIHIDLDYVEDNSNIVPTKMDLNIIYEDECFLILNKPSGIAVHPSLLHFKDTLSNGVKYYFDKINLQKKIRPINRLDFDTSRTNYFCKKWIYTRMFNKTNEKKYF